MPRSLSRRCAAALAAAVLAVPAAAQEPAAPVAAEPPAPIPVAVLAVPFPIAGEADSQVPVVVELGGRELLAGNPEGDLAGEIRIAAVDAEGRSVEEVVQPFVLDTADERLQRGLVLFAMLRLPAGEYGLHVAARNAATGAAGAWEGALRVPSFATGATTLSPPLFPQDPGERRVFRQSQSSHEGLPYPFQGAGGEVFLPAARGAAAAGATFHAFVHGGGDEPPQAFTARLVGAGGAASAVPVEVVATAPADLARAHRVTLRLAGSLPPPGAYRLELSGGGATAAAPVVVDGAERPPPPSLAVARSAEREGAPTPPELPPRLEATELAARYRELLLRAAGEGFDAALGELVALELAATPARRAGQLAALRAVEESVLERLGRDGGDGLLPVVYLHFLADGEYLRRGDPWMAAQNRRWVDQLLRRWLGGRPAAGERHLAAQLLAAIGNAQAALELEADNELALLRLAIAAERGGRLAEAAALLERLVAAHPQSDHGRLRLGIVRRRSGREADAVAVLQPLLERQEPRWIAGLACQELAAAERALGRDARAEAILRQGIERIGSQGVYLQLAFYLDQRQRSDDAVAVLDAMPLAAGRESSGRHLYNGAPEAEIAAARRAVEERVTAGVPLLRVALGAGVGAAAGGTR